jgi:hypothetical protein
MEAFMRRPIIDDVVRLMQDIPELSLIRGEIGVVRSTWFAPSVAYEVEFRNSVRGYQTRALLREEQVQVEDEMAVGIGENAGIPLDNENGSLVAGPVAG